jgi:hypothetical protein
MSCQNRIHEYEFAYPMEERSLSRIFDDKNFIS